MYKVQHNAKVISNEKICEKFYHLRLDATSVARQALPGSFIHIRIADGLKPFFRRPFSIYRAKKYVEILYEVVGEGTAILASKNKNETLDIFGPLGNTFSMPSKKIKQVVMIAGGIGIAPLFILSDFFKGKRYDITLLYGGRTKGHVFNFGEFKKNGCKVYVATNDGSVGTKGYVSNLFGKIKINKQTMLYTCGPKPMMKMVKLFAHAHNLPAEASCEEIMACGVGTCLGCSIKTTQGFKTVCNDGPVFDIHKIIL